jgi:hypothetical protein
MKMVPGRVARVGHQLADGGVGVGDLAVVAIDVAGAEVEAGPLVVGLVRLEEVQPEERLAGWSAWKKASI